MHWWGETKFVQLSKASLSLSWEADGKDTAQYHKGQFTGTFKRVTRAWWVSDVQTLVNEVIVGIEKTQRCFGTKPTSYFVCVVCKRLWWIYV